MKKIINNKWFYFIFIFLFMLVFNFLTPHIMDDWQLMYDYTGTKRITSIFEIFKELYRMYFNWGGRIFAHFFAYFFLMLPKWVFNIVNSIVYVLNVYLIYLIARGKNKNSYKYLLLIHMIIFIFFPTFAQVFLWLDGSCNYSFTLCVQLFFIYKILNIKSKNNYFIYIFVSLFAGMCNENSSLSLIVFLILYIIYDRSNLKLKVVSLISLVCGYLFLFLAPGNYVRMKTVGGRSLFDNIFIKFIFLLSKFWPILLAVLIFVIISYIKNNKKDKLCIILYLSSLVSFFSMMASPQLSIRSFTISVIYVFIIFVSMIFNMNSNSIKKIVFIVFSLIFIFVFIPTFKEYYIYYTFISNRNNLIRKSKENKKDFVKTKIYKASSNCRIPVSCDIEDIGIDNEDYPNRYIKKYYGIKVFGYK